MAMAVYDRRDGSEHGELYANSADADVVKVIENGCKLTILSRDWALQDGRVAVRLVDDGDISQHGDTLYWVDAAHVRIQSNSGMETWVTLSADAWNAGPWALDPAAFWIRMHPGARTNLEGDGLLQFDALVHSAKLPKPLRSCFDEFTYISLEVGRPIWRAVHATIAYAASMMCSHRRALNNHLEDIVHLYFRTPPCDRPSILTNYRRFEIGRQDAPSYEPPRAQGIEGQDPDKIKQLLDSDMIVPHTGAASLYGEKPELREIVARIHERDTSRYMDACARARRIPSDPHGFGIPLMLTDCSFGLGGEEQNLVLKDLLHYLSDAVWHCSHAYYYDWRKEKRVPPLVLSHTSWHVTQHDEWVKDP